MGKSLREHREVVYTYPEDLYSNSTAITTKTKVKTTKSLDKTNLDKILDWVQSGQPGIWIEELGEVKIFLYGMRKINENLATAGWNDPIESGWQVVDVWRDIEDNEIYTKPIKDKILEALFLLNKGQRVCVRCAAGMNRSNSIATAVLVYLDKKDNRSIEKVWNKHKKVVMKKVDRAWMNPDLGYTCQEAILELKSGKYTTQPFYCRPDIQYKGSVYKKGRGKGSKVSKK